MRVGVFPTRLPSASRRRRWRLLTIGPGGLLALGAVWYVGCLLFPFPRHRVREVGRSGATQILDREGGLIAWRVDGKDMWRLPVELDTVSPWAVAATIAAEDKRFRKHIGVDPLAAGRAMVQNLRHARRVSGASTVTMQTVRLLRPRRRTWSAKCIEAFRAVQMERLYDKATVLQVYLNLAPYGGNVIGIEAAARRYFDKGAGALTLGEAALLAGIPQRPARFNPRKRLAAALHRREYVLDRMRVLGLASVVELDAARREPIRLVETPVRSTAPRFADYLLARTGCRGGVLRTTITPPTQAISLAVAKRHARQFAAAGIDGLAVVVVDVNDATLAAMVGNAAPENPRTGWVDAATARRQPGSLLKPFIYALAYERGALTPATVVYDIPTRWNEYRPENIDREYRGPLPSRTALAASRNVPAVRLLERLGVADLAGAMASLELKPAGPPERYGLSLALGTAELSLLELTNAYAALARLGVYRPLRLTTDQPPGPSRRVFTPGAAWLTLRSLDRAERVQAPRRVWKTGTSWNHRDAWAICITPRYAIGVWCGNLSGRGHAGLVGAEKALPVALELAGRLQATDADGWPMPQGVAVREVCALSGSPRGRVCPHGIEAAYLPGISPEAPCRLHRMDRTGRTVVHWPAEAVAYEKRRSPADVAPRRGELTIVTPAPEAEYVDASPTGDAPVLELHAVTSAETVYWYVDGTFLSRCAAGETVLWRMRPGWHEVTAADDCGGSASRRFRVSSLAHSGRSR